MGVQYSVMYVRCSRYVCGIFRYGVCNICLCMCDVHVMCVGYFDMGVQYLFMYVRCSRYVCGIFRYGCVIFVYVCTMFTLCVWGYFDMGVQYLVFACTIFTLFVCDKCRYACGINIPHT